MDESLVRYQQDMQVCVSKINIMAATFEKPAQTWVPSIVLKHVPRHLITMHTVHDEHDNDEGEHDDDDKHGHTSIILDNNETKRGVMEAYLSSSTW